MMNRKQIITILSLIFLLSFMPVNQAQQINPDQNTDTKLTIYTYNTLLADPGYAFDRAFEEHAGLENNSVEVVLLEDAGTIVTKAASEKADPVADVLIGIDNVLVHQARQQDILEAYEPEGSENLIEGLVDNLASDHLLTPYDYGVISLYYLKNQFSSDLNLDNLKVEDLLDPQMQQQLIVENPQVSSPGLGFLLSTIAMYGDENIDGLIDGSWANFWRKLSKDTAMTNSWSDAFSLLYSEEANRSMMVSYTTSPAYGACLWEDYNTSAVLPKVDGKQYGWQQIEGIGLVKDAPNAELAKQFIDWFISDELQSQIHQNQWMYPAIQDIEAPDCYDAAIDPSTIQSLNDRISDTELANNLDNWLDTWEIAWAEGPENNNFLPFEGFVTLITIPVIAIVRRKLD